MADSADTFLGVVITLAVLTAIASGATGGAATNPTSSGSNRTTRSTVPSASTQSTNIPDGTLLACGGELIDTNTVDAGGGALTLQTYYSPVNGGRNCAVVTKTGTLVQRPGRLVITLQFHSYDGRKWPRYAIARSTPNATRVGGVYLDKTDNKCVRAWARFLPEDGPTATVRSGKVGCR